MSKIPQEAIEAAQNSLRHDYVHADNKTVARALEAADAARAQEAEVEPAAWQWRWKNNTCPWHQGRVPNWVKEAGDAVEERPLYTTPPAPKSTDREKVLEEALRPFAEIDPIHVYKSEDDDNGQYILTENQFRNARAALAGGEAPSQTDRAEGGE